MRRKMPFPTNTPVTVEMPSRMVTHELGKAFAKRRMPPGGLAVHEPTQRHTPSDASPRDP